MTVLLGWLHARTEGAKRTTDESLTELLYAPQGELVGQILLPPGKGSRGVEVVITVQGSRKGPVDRWVVFDEQGRFTYAIRESLKRVTVTTGIRAELYRVDAEDLPPVDRAGKIDLDTIDLRDQLVGHRLIVRPGEGALTGRVRMALCFGLPPVGPEGEPISLGSRQFPEIALGRAVDWLLPVKADSVYFLVERPLEVSGEWYYWRSGPQQLFGPYNSETLPAELVLD